MKKNLKILALLLAALMLFSACGAKEEVPEPAPAPTETPESLKLPEEPEPAPAPEPEPEPVKYQNPLSGLETDEDLSLNRPYAVMINNIKDAQPTMSTAKADIIYEYIAEGGITRLLAIFQSLDGVGTIGTV
ncbi:MAG: DUF3048 domain-containing protein, partial [Firmicutes bacterium]|nr:DUF3048 domain-containing protein [Bacillota bacterium]